MERPVRKSTEVSSPATDKADRILEASKGTSLASAPGEGPDGVNPLKKAIAYLCSLHRIDPPEEVDWGPLEDWLRRGKYRGYTLEDIREAAFLHADGTLEEVEHYGRGVSTLWIRKILDRYAMLRGPILNREAKKRALKGREISEEEKRANRNKLLEDLEEDYEATVNGAYWRKPFAWKYDTLVHEWAVMPMPPNEEKHQAMEEAEGEVRRQRQQFQNPFKAAIGGYRVKDEAKIICVRNFYLRLHEEGRHIKDVLNPKNDTP